MRKIKFRGRDIDTGKFIYAELGEIVEERRGYYAFLSVPGTAVVTDKSLAQLVGYDKNGKEIYEGDVVTFIDSGDNVIEQEAMLFDNIPSYAVLKETNNEKD